MSSSRPSSSTTSRPGSGATSLATWAAMRSKWAFTCDIASSEISHPSCICALWLFGSNVPSACARSRLRAKVMHSPCGRSRLSMPSFSNPLASSCSEGTQTPGATTPAQGMPSAASFWHVLSSQRVLPIWISPVSMKSTPASSRSPLRRRWRKYTSSRSIIGMLREKMRSRGCCARAFSGSGEGR